MADGDNVVLTQPPQVGEVWWASFNKKGPELVMVRVEGFTDRTVTLRTGDLQPRRWADGNYYDRDTYVYRRDRMEFVEPVINAPEYRAPPPPNEQYL